MTSSDTGTERADHARRRRQAVNAPSPAATYSAYASELDAVLDAVLAGDLVERAEVERRAVESLGALAWLVRLHRVDGRGRCRVCRSRWGRRSVCTVYRALALHVRRSGDYVPAAVTAGADGAGRRL